ncbi:hypothetical protein [Streptacidiphilus carbonis]|uniref:hypothetical protein n=1 Tax=Streptacidiphilus carbonis TaxID=105422 RepID=UPI0005A6FB4B|nr:hypothetical protein [Streptacidiphilus carbonis]
MTVADALDALAWTLGHCGCCTQLADVTATDEPACRGEYCRTCLTAIWTLAHERLAETEGCR